MQQIYGLSISLLRQKVPKIDITIAFDYGVMKN